MPFLSMIVMIKGIYLITGLLNYSSVEARLFRRMLIALRSPRHILAFICYVPLGAEDQHFVKTATKNKIEKEKKGEGEKEEDEESTRSSPERRPARLRAVGLHRSPCLPCAPFHPHGPSRDRCRVVPALQAGQPRPREVRQPHICCTSSLPQALHCHCQLGTWAQVLAPSNSLTPQPWVP